MNDSFPGNSGDTDGDFDLSGFMDDSDPVADSKVKPKAPDLKAKSAKASEERPQMRSQVRPQMDRPSARISKGHRDIKTPVPDPKVTPGNRNPGNRSTGFSDRGGRDERGARNDFGPRSDRGGRDDRNARNDRGGFNSRSIPHGDGSSRGEGSRGGAWDKAPRREGSGSAYPARKPGFNRDVGSKGSSSIHHIPPRVIERVGGEIHKPASAEIKPFLPLKTDKGRWKESQFLLEGAKNIADVMSVGSAIITTVLYSEDFQDLELLTLMKKNRIELVKVTQDDIRNLADTESPQGIIAVANFATLRPDWSLARYVTLLDGVQDPGNVGAILRTSLALGMDAVVVGKGSCDPYNPKVVRSSVGALMRLPFETGEDLGAKMEFLRLKGFSIVATSSHAKLTLDQAKLRKKVALIVGNEGAGTGAQYQDMADAVVKIPLKNKVESLNVSVAHGILTYQLIHGRT
jgi:RNA methyltransferase, TrmH family